jgi:hypothetical protein
MIVPGPGSARMRLAILFVLCLATGLSTAARADSASGRVFLDRNANGQRDAGEPGIAGVRLSNGRELVVTDRHGRYRIEVQPGDTLFVIKPPQHAFPRRADGTPDFWRHHFPLGSPPLRYGGIAPSRAGGDFALLDAGPAGDLLEVLLFGDPQPKSAVDVDYYARDIVEPLIGHHAAQLGVSLGDIVDDDLSLYPAMNAVTRRLGLPWLHVPGNHDIDTDATDDADSLLGFRNVFGPDSYAWEEPQASFIVLDDVLFLPGQRPAYIGGFRDSQLDWLARYLAPLDRERRLVLAAHIPLFDTRPDRETFRRADRERLFALLAPFRRVLVLSAHSHIQQHHLHGTDSGWPGAEPLHEYNVGAACGGFWSGVADDAGIPDATMADGTPNGHARLQLSINGDYALFWQAARQPDDYQIALHAPQVLRAGSWPGVAVYANVFMGMADSRVEYRIGERDWRPMQRVLRPDPRVLAENLRDDASPALRGHDRTPEAQPSPHLWRGTLPTDLGAGEHRIEVRAFDRWRGELRAATTYRLEIAP